MDRPAAMDFSALFSDDGASSSSTLFPNWTPADIYTFMLKYYEYNDGGAFAEVHVPQFPNGVGLNGIVSNQSMAAAVMEEKQSNAVKAMDASGQQLMLTAGTSSSHATTTATAAAASSSFSSSSGVEDVTHTAGASSSSSTAAAPLPSATSAAAAPPSNNPYALALLPDTSRMSAHDESLLRRAQGGLLVVHTAESALTTKTFTAEELRKPTDDVIQSNLERTKAALAAVLCEQMKGSSTPNTATTTTTTVSGAVVDDKGSSNVGGSSDSKGFNPFLPNAVAAKQQAKEEMRRDRNHATNSNNHHHQQKSSALTIIIPTAAAHYTNVKNTNAVGSAYDSDPAPILRSPTKRQAMQHSSTVAESGGVGAVFGAATTTAAVSSSSSSSGGAAATSLLGAAGSVPARPTQQSTFSQISAGGMRMTAVVNNYKNKKGMIYSLDQRTAAQGATATTEVVELNQRHFDVAKALSAAQKEREVTAAANFKAQEEAERRLREKGEADALRRAHEALEKRAAEMGGGGALTSPTGTAGGGAADPSAAGGFAPADASAAAAAASVAQQQQFQLPQQPLVRETREQRAARILAERTAREEEAEEERKEKRLAKTAARLGITREALEGDAGLMAAVNSNAASGGGADGSGGGPSVRSLDGVEVDPRVMQLANSDKSLHGMSDIGGLLSGTGGAVGGPDANTAASGGAGGSFAAAMAYRGGSTMHLHSNARIEAEMKRQEALEQEKAATAATGATVSATAGQKRATRGGDSDDSEDDSDDDDVFGLKKKQSRAE